VSNLEQTPCAEGGTLGQAWGHDLLRAPVEPPARSHAPRSHARRGPLQEATVQRLEPSQLNQIQLYRPLCSKCGAPTQLARIVPATEPDYDERTFACVMCDNTDVLKIRFK